MKIILASRSPRRLKLLRDNGYDVSVDISHADEDLVKSDNVKEKVMDIARLKAETVAARHKDSIIIAADTLVYFEGQEIGQQKDKESAMKILKKLLGKTHEVYTGIYMINTKSGKFVQDAVVSNVKLRNVSEDIISSYINSGQYKGKAAAYNIDDQEFVSFIESVDGSYTNIMGLPIEKIKPMLEVVS